MRQPTKRDPENRLPLKDLELQILMALAGGERHGWSIVKELQEEPDTRKRILPGTFYRTLNGLSSEGLIEEVERPPDHDDDPRRKYFKLTAYGVAVCRAEIDRLGNLVMRSRSLEMLSAIRLRPSGRGEG